MAELERSDTKSTPHATPISSSELTVNSPTTKEYAAISNGPSRSASRHGKEARSTRTLSRTRSNNGYGCDDGTDEGQDAEAGGAEGASPEKDPWEVRWENGDDDPDNPRSMSMARKWLIVIIVSASSCCVEFYGRRPIYLVSFSFFLIWIIPSAVANNIQTMLIARFFDGLSGSAFLSVAGGTVGDLFNREDLQLPMLIYTASPFVGPSLGPLLGGFINQYTSWRWTFYLLLIVAFVDLALIAIFVPETYHPVLLRNRARKLRKETGEERWRSALEKSDKSILKTVGYSLTRPFQLLFLEPMVSNLCLFSAILLGILYLFFGAFPVVFQGQHDFTLSQTGLSFLGILVGMVLGCSTDPFWHRNYVRLIKQREVITGEVGGSEPEYRLPPAIAGAPLVTVGLFMFGWTTYSSIHWIIPIIGSTIFGMGVVLVFSGIFTFLVDAYPLYAASALAANSFARSSFGAVFPLFGVQMYKKLGNQWATSLLAFLTLVMLPFPYIFFVYGKRMRGKSRFASAGAS